MRIVTLTENEFYSFHQKVDNDFYQDPLYGKLMTMQGFNYKLVGLVNDDKEILATSLILFKNIFKSYKYAYIPGGFLINYNDVQLLGLFSQKLRQFLNKNQIIFLNINPHIIHKTIDKNGNVLKIENEKIVESLNKLGYILKPASEKKDKFKPEYNAVLKLDVSIQELYNSFTQEIQENIKTAIDLGITIHKGHKGHLELLYNFAFHKYMKKLDFYCNYYDIFNKSNLIDIYYSKLYPLSLLQNLKNKYSKEQERNQYLISKLSTTLEEEKDDRINQKINSDKLLDYYKREITKITKLLKENPEGLIVSIILVVKYKEKLHVILEGNRFKDNDWGANSLLKWALITKFTRKGYKEINFNGVSGDFKKNKMFEGLSTLKLGFTNRIEKSIGDFDLPINKTLYFFLNKFKLFNNYILKSTSNK